MGRNAIRGESQAAFPSVLQGGEWNVSEGNQGKTITYGYDGGGNVVDCSY